MTFSRRRQGEVQRSLGGVVLRTMVLPTTLLVLVLTVLTYQRLYRIELADVMSQLASQSELRAATEAQFFTGAERNGARFAAQFLLREQDPAPEDLDARLEALAPLLPDGSRRSPEAGFSTSTEVALSVRAGAAADPALRRRLLVAHDLLATAGPIMIGDLTNAYVVLADGSMARYWPGRQPFAMVHPGVDLGPSAVDRRPAWSAVYPDPVSGAWMTTITTPIWSGDEFVGTVAQDLALSDLIARNGIQPLVGARTVIVRATDGALVSAPGVDDELVRRATAAAKHLGDAGGVVNEDGYLIGVAHVGGPDWHFVTMYPETLVVAHAGQAATALFALAGASVVGTLLVLYAILRRLVSAPLHQLTTTAGQIADGDLTVRVAVARPDEVGSLGVAFNHMADAVQAQQAELARHAEDLERKVAERTAQLEAQTRDLRRVLDTARQGFVTIDLSGRMSPVRSKIVGRWLGEAESDLLPDYLGFVDPVAAEWLQIGLQAVAEDLLPRELTLSQLPRRVSTGLGVLDVEYIPIEEDGALVNLLVVLTDVTGQIERERIEREQHEVVAIFQRISANPWSFTDFFDESKQMVELLESGPPPTVALRIIHTLKGNCATFGISSMELVCHEVEEDAKVDGLDEGLVQRVITAWQSVQARVRTLLPQKRSATISVSEVEYRALVERIREVAPEKDLLEALDAWQLEPVQDRLETLGEHGKRLADRLGKGPLHVQIDAHGLRLESGRWTSFWAALLHAVRNAVDHGIEPEEERIVNGKAPVARLRLESRVDGEQVVISVEDDGRGIDWAAVAARAGAMGLPNATRDELEAALFVDGFSTREVVTTVSGRGVGLPALLGEVNARGGTIHVTSEARAGARIEIRVPTHSGQQSVRWAAA